MFRILVSILEWPIFSGYVSFSEGNWCFLSSDFETVLPKVLILRSCFFCTMDFSFFCSSFNPQKTQPPPTKIKHLQQPGEKINYPVIVPWMNRIFLLNEERLRTPEFSSKSPGSPTKNMLIPSMYGIFTYT